MAVALCLTAGRGRRVCHSKSEVEVELATVNELIWNRFVNFINYVDP